LACTRTGPGARFCRVRPRQYPGRRASAAVPLSSALAAPATARGLLRNAGLRRLGDLVPHPTPLARLHGFRRTRRVSRATPHDGANARQPQTPLVAINAAEASEAQLFVLQAAPVARSRGPAFGNVTRAIAAAHRRLGNVTNALRPLFAAAPSFPLGLSRATLVVISASGLPVFARGVAPLQRPRLWLRRAPKSSG
jgi:hypothetical protein